MNTALDHPGQVEIIHRIRRIDIVIIDPTLDRVDGEEPAQRRHIHPRPHLHDRDRPLMLVKLPVPTDERVVGIAFRVVDHRIIRGRGSDTPGERVDRLPPRVIPDHGGGANSVAVGFEDDAAEHVRIRPLLTRV